LTKSITGPHNTNFITLELLGVLFGVPLRMILAFVPTFVTNKPVERWYIEIIIIIKREIYLTRNNLFKTKKKETENNQYIS
jgi:hypothetical protein